MGEAAPVLLGAVLAYLVATGIRGPDAPWPWDRARADAQRVRFSSRGYRIVWWLSLFAGFAVVTLVFWRVVRG